MKPTLTICAASFLVLWLQGCERAPGAAAPAPAPQAPTKPSALDTAAPNAGAAHYGPHGVAATPPSAAGTNPTAPGPGTPREGDAPPLDTQSMGDMAGHACHCGAGCKCGHCAGAVPGCHCKAERTDTK